ncbi:exodeoxyribonuclease V subunit beta [Allobaculum fili]|uniref:UvrD-helicase domain-containing protein n=1 Tax=Allobaculum TaxID=174708 RepID=UPI001E5D9466|nr:UvrD-helicase domain-containing protein [Allobaculum fili]
MEDSTKNEAVQQALENDAQLDRSQDSQMQELPKKPLVFSPAQQKVIDSRNKNLLVSASAGAGKTAVLVERLCRLVVDDHVPVSSILAVTFTEDAAAEMKVRLKNRLMEAAKTDPSLNKEIGALETAMICTIHSFCLSIVQQYYFVAGLPYSMVNRIDNDLADSQALEEAVEQSMQALDPARSAELLLYMEACGQKEEHLRSRLLRYLSLAESKADPDGWMNACRHEAEDMSAWFLKYFDVRCEALIDIFEEMIEEVQVMDFAKAAKQSEYIERFSRKVEALERCREALAKGDYEAFGAQFIEYAETTDKFTPTINKISFKDIQTDSRKFEKEIADVLFTRKQYEESAKQIERVRNTFIDLAIDVRRRFQEIKKKAGFIDFSDMELYAWKILQDPETAKALRDRFEVILIDEYQDTNDLQETIIQAIARKNNVFRVGDIKQSIYGFRQARPQLMKNHLEHPGEYDEIVAMQENYRSSDSLIRFNNDFFRHLMNVDGLPSQFSAIDTAVTGSARQKEQAQKPVRFLYTEFGKDARLGESLSAAGAQKEHRENRFDLIAQDIENHVKKEGIALRDIAILTRSSTSHDKIKKALEAWGIRSVHHVRHGFYTNKAVQVVLSAMRVIEDERNDIALMSVLASPLTGFTQQDILPMLSGSEDGQSLYTRLRQSEKGYELLKIVRDLKTLKDLSLPEMIVGIYQIRGFYDYSTSAQDKTNLDLLLEKAVSAQGLLDLEGFLSSAALEEDLDKTSEAMPFGKEEDAVHISTIHASKGLQYKLVYILCEQRQSDIEGMSPILLDADLGVAFKALDPNTMLSHKSAATIAFDTKRFFEEQQEKMRLLYVACTRAEEELVFVDTLKNENLYDGTLNLYRILANNGFTSWFFSLYHRNPIDLVDFEDVPELLQRPDRGVSHHKKISIRRYQGPRQIVYSQTASKTKAHASWPKGGYGKGVESGLAKERGTLFHEMAATLPWPYTREDVEERLRQSGLGLSSGDADLLLRLNDNATYAKWMELPHEFECPYCVMEKGTIIHGYMDLVVFDGDTIDILDFKTDAAFDEQSLADRYRGQLETYRKAMQSIHPDRKVRAWIYSFELASLFEI